jgi:hypothetical protein
MVGCRAGVAGPMALGMFAGSEVSFDDILDEIGGGRDFRFCVGFGGAAHSKNLFD